MPTTGTTQYGGTAGNRGDREPDAIGAGEPACTFGQCPGPMTERPCVWCSVGGELAHTAV